MTKAAAAVPEVLAAESPSDPTPLPARRKRVKPDDESALMLERLVKDPNVDPVKLEKMIEMVERVQATRAKAAFTAAFAEMLPEIPTIIETAKTDKTTYAPLEDIVEQVKPILFRHGFSLSFKTEWPEGARIKITGLLTHEQGHERTSEFLSAPDQTGSKNAIQAQASTISYGKRYTTCDLLAIVTRKEDDDGETAGRKGAAKTEEVPVQPHGYQEWLIDLTACADNGSPALEAMWRAPKSKPHREHLYATDKQKWERIKVRAGVADVTLRGGKPGK